MVEVESEAERRGSVTLVSATVRNPLTTAQTVRLESCLDGPVWPPRVGRTTSPAWDGDVWRTTLPPGATEGVGFASPAPPVDPPVRIRSVERADPSADDRRPAEVLATLDEWAPPRAVVADRR